MNAAANVFFLILRVFSLYFLAVSLLGLCRRLRQGSADVPDAHVLCDRVQDE